MLTGVVYAYLVSFVIVSLAGCVIQFKYFNNKDEKDQKNENKKAEEETTIDVDTKKPLMSKH